MAPAKKAFYGFIVPQVTDLSLDSSSSLDFLKYWPLCDDQDVRMITEDQDDQDNCVPGSIPVLIAHWRDYIRSVL